MNARSKPQSAPSFLRAKTPNAMCSQADSSVHRVLGPYRGLPTERDWTWMGAQQHWYGEVDRVEGVVIGAVGIKQCHAARP